MAADQMIVIDPDHGPIAKALRSVWRFTGDTHRIVVVDADGQPKVWRTTPYRSHAADDWTEALRLLSTGAKPWHWAGWYMRGVLTRFTQRVRVVSASPSPEASHETLSR